ncbi:hypothetical protein SAMN02800687_0533 [Curtobacterium sp. UNCCL20]|nr:hypothetical protein SAMN02800687_0533 [Curtobacterium sp. UNCCL20]
MPIFERGPVTPSLVKPRTDLQLSRIGNICAGNTENEGTVLLGHHPPALLRIGVLAK